MYGTPFDCARLNATTIAGVTCASGNTFAKSSARYDKARLPNRYPSAAICTNRR